MQCRLTAGNEVELGRPAEAPFEEVCTEAGSCDLAEILGGEPSMKWNTAANMSWLCKETLVKLFLGLFKVAPNGRLGFRGGLELIV